MRYAIIYRRYLYDYDRETIVGYVDTLPEAIRAANLNQQILDKQVYHLAHLEYARPEYRVERV